MIILVLDAEKIDAPLVYEDCYETGHAFPHIYGAITPECVVKIIDFPCGTNGEFSLPPNSKNNQPLHCPSVTLS